MNTITNPEGQGRRVSMRNTHRTLFLVVRNPLPWFLAWAWRILPPFIRGAVMAEEYMGLEVYPFWSWDWRAAKMFESASAARAYIFNLAGERRSGFENAAVRRVRLRMDETAPLQ